MTATAAGMRRTPSSLASPVPWPPAPSQLGLLSLLPRFIGEWLAAVDSSSWLPPSCTPRSVAPPAEDASIGVKPS